MYIVTIVCARWSSCVVRVCYTYVAHCLFHKIDPVRIVGMRVCVYVCVCVCVRA